MVHRVTMSGKEWYIVWQQVATSGTTSDNEWQRVTTNGNKWYNKWHRITKSSTTSDNECYHECQRVAKNNNESQWMTTSGTVFIFKDPSGLLLPKWIWIINKLIWMNQFQKSYWLKNFLWWTWFWQSARSKTLHLVSSGRCNRPRRENFENSWKKDSLKKVKINRRTFLLTRDL